MSKNISLFSAICQDSDCATNEHCDTDPSVNRCVCDGDFQYDNENNCVRECPLFIILFQINRTEKNMSL